MLDKISLFYATGFRAQGDLADTMADLLFDMSSGVVLISVAIFSYRRGIRKRI